MLTTSAAAALSPNAKDSPPDARTRARHENLTSADPNVLVTTVEDAGIAWADADEEASLLEETKKTLLAQYILEAQRGATKPLPMNQAEQAAMGDPRYKTHIENMVKARSKANRARVRYDSGKTQLDLLRTLMSNERAKMQFAGQRT